jgi:hypothetical protein
MISVKLVLKILPWLLLIVIVFALYITNYKPFGSKDDGYQHLIETSVILKEVESLGRLELVKYNFKEVFEYKKLSDGKIVGSSILKTYDYDPDISVIMIAAGEATGCIDLTKINITDIDSREDTLILTLPLPEICYHKLDLDNTKVYSTSKESWWSKLFSEKNEQNEVLQMAYKQAETKLREAAIKSGIYEATNENAKILLVPLLQKITGKKVFIETSIPEKSLAPPL